MTRPPSYPWHICGVGAIGGLWANALADQCLSVTLLLKDAAHLAQYQELGGVRVTDGEYQSFLQPEALVPGNLLDTKIKHL